MNINCEMYNNLNGAQVRDAHELLDRILQDGVEKADTIVDIGCGSGNVTSILSQKIPHSLLLAVDIDPDMVNLARMTNGDDQSITILVQDISLPWEELHPKLKSLEGTVDLIFSNRVLHWIFPKNRTQASKNISRLLRPQGHFYANTTCIVDPTKFILKFEETNHHEMDERGQNNNNFTLSKIPSKKEQEEEWLVFAQEANLTSIQIQFVIKDWTYPNQAQFDAIFDAITSYYRRYLPAEMGVEEKDVILDKHFRDAIITGSSIAGGAWTEIVVDEDQQNNRPIGDEKDQKYLKTTYYGQFQVKGVKI